MTGKQLPEQPRSVNKLMDAERVSEYLGVARSTIRSWEKRRIEGKPGGPPKDFPPPIADRLSGGALWNESEVVAYRRRREANKNTNPGSRSAEAETAV